MDDEQDSTLTTTSESICSDSISYESIEDTQQQNPGIVSRVAGGAYNATTTILGGAKNAASSGISGATWITGTAISSSFGVVRGVSSYVLPARFRPAAPKDKAE